jgi:hypothetical protein
MALTDDIAQALEDGAHAGATAAAMAGKNLMQDLDAFVLPHLNDIAIQVASIVVKRQQDIYTDGTAKALIDSEEDALQTLVDTADALTVFEAQTVVNAMVDALNKVVNDALGFALLA